MKEFSPAQAPLFTFYSRPFYKDLLSNGKGIGFLYLFVLIFVCWSLQSGKVYFMLSSGLENADTKNFLEQIPALSLKDGKLSMDKPSPLTIKDKKGTALITIDLSGKTKSLEEAGGAQVLVTEEYIIAEKSTGVQEAIPLSKINTDLSFDREKLEDFLRKIVPWLSAVIWAFGVFVWLGHLVQALLYSIFGLIINRQKLSYGSLIRLASFAMTPAVLLSCLQVLAGFEIPFYGVIAMVMTIGFMYFGYSSLSGEAS